MALTIILVPKKDVPLIAFSGFVRGGALADPADKPGVASLVAGLLDRGAGKRSAFEFADAVEGVGGSFNAGAGAESISVSGQFLARDRALLIELLSDALIRPRFDADEVTKYRDREIEFIKSAKDSDPAQLLPEYGRAMLFGAHPYGRPQGGSERSLAAISQADVVSYHASRFGADKATLVFAGDLEAKWMKQALTKAFGGWAKSKATLPGLEPAARVTGRRVLLVERLTRCRPTCGSEMSASTAVTGAAAGAGPGQYGVWRPVHVDAQHRTAHQVGPVIRGELRLCAWHGGWPVRDRLVHADRKHRQGAGPHAPDPGQAQARRARAGDAGIRARLRAGPIPAAARDRGALGGGARRSRVLRPGQGLH
jgi:hypothetical protein